MTAAYPTNVKVFPVHVDYTEIIIAQTMNDVQDEIVALQNTIGTNPQNPPFFNTVKDRIANLERLRHYAGSFTITLNPPGATDGIFFFPGFTFAQTPSVQLTAPPMHRNQAVTINATDISVGSFHWYAYTNNFVTPPNTTNDLTIQVLAIEFDGGH